MVQTSDSAQTSSAHSSSSVSISPPNNYELLSQLSLTAAECVELENKWKQLMTKRLTLQNQLANINTDSGNASNSSDQLSTNSNASYIPMKEIPDLLSVKTPSIPTSLFTAMNETRANYSIHPSTRGIFKSADLGVGNDNFLYLNLTLIILFLCWTCFFFAVCRSWYIALLYYFYIFRTWSIISSVVTSRAFGMADY